MARIAVSNSSPLIVLRKAARLELLQHSFDEILIPQQVAEEIQTVPDFVIVRSIQNSDLLKSLELMADSGEAAAIALAMESDDAAIVLDDRKARQTAQRLGLKVVGTLGLAIDARREGKIAAVKPVIDEFLRVGLYISKGLVERTLNEFNE